MAADPTVEYSTPTPKDLGDYLDLESVNEVRAALLIEQAEDLTRAVVTPLPRSARTVVISAAARAYVNPQGTSYQVAGPFSMQGTAGGLFLTKDERRTLQLLAGRGSAFTVDPTPADAGGPSWGPVTNASGLGAGWSP